MLTDGLGSSDGEQIIGRGSGCSSRAVSIRARHYICVGIGDGTASDALLHEGVRGADGVGVAQTARLASSLRSCLTLPLRVSRRLSVRSTAARTSGSREFGIAEQGSCRLVGQRGGMARDLDPDGSIGVVRGRGDQVPGPSRRRATARTAVTRTSTL